MAAQGNLVKGPLPTLLGPTPPKRRTSVRAYRPKSVNRYRFVRAYSTTFVVLGSYLWLSFKSRLFGGMYWQDRIGAIHKRNARRVYVTILSLQGLFIKVGQLLSILANFLPEVFRHELEGLQDQVPPRPFEEIAARVEDELEGSIDDLFESFERSPIASASLGQVHEARLIGGRRVAVKVQHQEIDETVRLDLRTIRRIMQIVQWFVPVQGLDAYYHQIKELLMRELDFGLEADSIDRISKNFLDDPRVLFPIPIRERSTRRVLTLTFVEGTKVGDAQTLRAKGIDTKDVAERLVRVFCQMVLKDGYYHADPHPGNVLVDDAGNLVLIDFGATAELSTSMREGIPEFLEGVIRRDSDRLVKALRKMGFLSRTSDDTVIEKVIEYFHRRFQEEVKLDSFNLKDVKIDPQRGLESFLDLRKMNVGLKELSSAFHIPKDWVLLERTILLVYGSCALLDPELEPVKIIRPYLQDFVLGDRDFGQLAVATLKDMALQAMTLPEDLRKYLVKSVRGEMEVRVRGLDEGTRAIYTIGRQLIYTVVTIAAGSAWVHFDEARRPFPAKFALAVAMVSAFLLVWSSLFGRPRRRRGS